MNKKRKIPLKIKWQAHIFIKFCILSLCLIVLACTNKNEPNDSGMEYALVQKTFKIIQGNGRHLFQGLHIPVQASGVRNFLSQQQSPAGKKHHSVMGCMAPGMPPKIALIIAGVSIALIKKQVNFSGSVPLLRGYQKTSVTLNPHMQIPPLQPMVVTSPFFLVLKDCMSMI
jgi:hypothetical protein